MDVCDSKVISVETMCESFENTFLEEKNVVGVEVENVESDVVDVGKTLFSEEFGNEWVADRLLFVA